MALVVSERETLIGACRLFGTDAPTSLRTLCGHTKVAAAPPAGANHTVAEAFADR